ATRAMCKTPRGASRSARPVRHSHRKTKGGCPVCRRRVPSMGRIGSMRLRAGQGEITDMAAAGSRLTRLQPTYIDAVVQRSFVEPEPAPEAPPARINAVEMATRIAARKPEAPAPDVLAEPDAP